MIQRLLHLIENLQDEGNHRLLPSLFSGLQRQGYDLHVGSLSQAGPLKNELDDRKIPLTTLTRRWKYDPQTLWQLRRSIQRLAPEVIHAWSPLTHFYARWSAQGTRVRIISPHDEPSVFPVSPPNNSCDQKTGAILNSQSTRKDLGLPPTTRLLLAVNQGLSHRALKRLVWTMCMLDQLRGDILLFVFGKSKQHAQIERYCRLTQSNHRVRFFDHCQDLPKYLHHADCFVSSSESWGQSEAIREAMAAGVPVVATDLPKHRTLITHDQTGILVPVGERSEIARWIHVLLDEKEMASRLSRNAKSHVERNFSVDQIVNRYTQLYRKSA